MCHWYRDCHEWSIWSTTTIMMNNEHIHTFKYKNWVEYSGLKQTYSATSAKIHVFLHLLKFDTPKSCMALNFTKVSLMHFMSGTSYHNVPTMIFCTLGWITSLAEIQRTYCTAARFLWEFSIHWFILTQTQLSHTINAHIRPQFFVSMQATCGPSGLNFEKYAFE